MRWKVMSEAEIQLLLLMATRPTGRYSIRKIQDTSYIMLRTHNISSTHRTRNVSSICGIHGICDMHSTQGTRNLHPTRRTPLCSSIFLGMNTSHMTITGCPQRKQILKVDPQKLHYSKVRERGSSKRKTNLNMGSDPNKRKHQMTSRN